MKKKTKFDEKFGQNLCFFVKTRMHSVCTLFQPDFAEQTGKPKINVLK